jgi:thiol-disulfide isomerase/thioredoxin
MTPKESIIKNILLISIALFIFLKSNDIKTPLIAPIIFSLLTISSIWIILPIPNNKNFPFKEFTQFEPSGRIDLAKKNAFVAIFNLDCEHCQEVAKELAELKRTSQNIPEVYVLFYQEGNSSVEKFENITGSKYPYTFIDVNTFFDLIGNSPPRIYYIKDGSVIEVWDENHLESIKKRFAINQEAIKEL